MDPSIEIQITARLDRLDAGLRVAEGKIQEATERMSSTVANAGNKGGNQFIENLQKNIIKGLAMGAISTILGNGLLTLAKDINAEKSGKEIGEDIAKGIVDGAKGLPVIGVFIAILDEVVNGFDRIVDAQFKSMLAKTQAFSDAIAAKMVSTAAAAQGIENKLKVMGAKDDPKKLAEVNKQIQIQSANDRLQAIQDEKQTAIRAYLEVQKARKESIDKEEASVSMTGAALRAMGNEDITSFDDAEEAKAKIDEETERGLKALNSTNDEEKNIAKLKIAIEKDTADQIAKINKEIADNEKAIKEKTLQENRQISDKEKAEAEKLAKTLEQIQKKAAEEYKNNQREKYEAAIQVQQNIIDGERSAKEQIDKVGRVDQIARQAAQGMINSGQTALGQFNFAQDGASNQAITLAQKQVASLEKIETATAEQVRLQKEMGGFR